MSDKIKPEDTKRIREILAEVTAKHLAKPEVKSKIVAEAHRRFRAERKD
jgi:hypothetical protein